MTAKIRNYVQCKTARRRAGESVYIDLDKRVALNTRLGNGLQREAER